VIVASAPGRVNLIGEHTDYNGGDVLPIAISQRTTVTAQAMPTETVSRVASSLYDGVEVLLERPPTRSGDWSDYLAGVVVALGHAGLVIPAFRAAITSDLPAGAGLSSSAALEIAAGLALTRLTGKDVDPTLLAQCGTWAEREFVGVATGVMDQLVSAMAQPGRALYIHCATGAFEVLPFLDWVLIFDTGVSRTLTTSAFNQRQQECQGALAILRRDAPDLATLAAADATLVRSATLPPPLDRRARHVATEMQRVRQAAAALRAGQAIAADLLYQSHESLRSDFECSCPELDWFVEYASTLPGLRGARLTGAGWGGCAIAIGTEDALREVAPRMLSAYARRFPHPARTWITPARAGARIEREDT